MNFDLVQREGGVDSPDGDDVDGCGVTQYVARVRVLLRVAGLRPAVDQSAHRVLLGRFAEAIVAQMSSGEDRNPRVLACV